MDDGFFPRGDQNSGRAGVSGLLWGTAPGRTLASHRANCTLCVPRWQRRLPGLPANSHLIPGRPPFRAAAGTAKTERSVVPLAAGRQEAQDRFLIRLPGTRPLCSRFQDLQPASVDQLASIIKDAAPAGGTTVPAPGAPARRLPPIELSALNRLIDYPARDMTVTVQAGMTTGELERLLSAELQQLPIDSPDPEMTLGQLVADDVHGPRCCGYGTLRDYVIGIEAVDGCGRVFHAGGRVVKNVAGYDLCRLLVGARNCLAILTQLTFKLVPLPVTQGLLLASYDSWQAAEAALERLNLSAARPAVLDLCNRQAFFELADPDRGGALYEFGQRAGVACLIVGVEGQASVRNWQLQQLQQELQPGAADMSVPDDPAVMAAWCRRGTVWPVAPPDGFVRICRRTLPSQVCRSAKWLTAANAPVVCRAGTGEVFALLPESGLTDILNQIPKEADTSLMVLTSSGITGTERDSERELTRRLRQEFDPHHLLPDFFETGPAEL